MTPDDPHGMDEGEGIRITAGLAAGLDHQPAQRQVDEQQSIEFLFGQVGTVGAQHQPLARQRDLQFRKRAFFLPTLMIQGGQFRRRRLGRIEQGGDQTIQRFGIRNPVEAILDDPHRISA